METTIDKAGRLVIPKALRERLGLGAGARVDITEADGALLLRPTGPQTRVIHRRGRPVLKADEQVEPLTTEAVRRIVEQDRR